MVPWKNGRLLVCDVTCPNTFAPSYIAWSSNRAGAVASLAEEKKVLKCNEIIKNPL